MDLYYFEVLWWSRPVHVPDLHSRDSRSQMNSGFEIGQEAMDFHHGDSNHTFIPESLSSFVFACIEGFPISIRTLVALETI